MQRNITFSEGEYYHLYNRGVDKRKIFLDEHDYQRFLKLLYIANGEQAFVFRDIEKKPLSEIDRGQNLTAVGAYVLMPNHFHLLVKETIANGISEYMKKLLTGYAAYFNKRHGRVGSLFQGPFKAQHLNRDEYLKYIFAYIHLNPVKLTEPKWKEGGIKNSLATKKFLLHYPYSSYPEYIGQSYVSRQEEGLILTKTVFPKYFQTAKSHEDYIEDWMNFKDVLPGTGNT